MPTLRQCIDLYHAAQARRLNDPGYPPGHTTEEAVAEHIDSETTHSGDFAFVCSDTRSATVDSGLTPTGKLRWTDESRWAWGAKRLGIPYGEYASHVAAGERWCSGHRAWEPLGAFVANRRRRDGVQTYCVAYNREQARLKMRALRAARRAS